MNSSKSHCSIMPFCPLFFSYNTYTRTCSFCNWRHRTRLQRDACTGFLHGTHTVSASHPGGEKHRFAVVALNAWSFRDFPRNRAGSCRSTLRKEGWWSQSALLFFPPIVEGMTILNIRLFSWGTQLHGRKGDFNKGAVNQKGK